MQGSLIPDKNLFFAAGGGILANVAMWAAGQYGIHIDDESKGYITTVCVFLFAHGYDVATGSNIKPPQAPGENDNKMKLGE
jgi:hypothetical protein